PLRLTKFFAASTVSSSELISCQHSGMKLPNPEKAIVERQKITDYLLNPAHRFGASKARFFAAFGFRLTEWETLAAAFKEHGKQHEITRTKQTAFGPRYEVEGDLVSPDGRCPRVRTVWQMDEGQIAPRLITAYPLHAL